MSTAVKTLDDLFDKCVPEPNTGCWLWLEASRRYGATWFGRKVMQAHRVAMILAHGDIPDDMRVCHKCDVPLCCNPAHLFLGTQAENLADMRKKGRAGDQYGEKNPRAKLSSADALYIRSAVAGGAKQKDLAIRFGVAECTISNLVAGRFWKRDMKETT